MAVFDIAGSQVKVDPVGNYYKGKALRAGIKSQELANEGQESQNTLLKDKADNVVSDREAAEKALELDRKKAELDIAKGIQELGYKRMKSRSDAIRPVIEEAENLFKSGKQDEASSYISQALPAALQDVDPEAAAQIAEMAGADKIWQPEEMMRLKNRIEAFGKIEKTEPEYQNLATQDGQVVGFFEVGSPEFEDAKSRGLVLAGDVSQTQKTQEIETPPGFAKLNPNTQKFFFEQYKEVQTDITAINAAERALDNLDEEAFTGITAGGQEVIAKMLSVVVDKDNPPEAVAGALQRLEASQEYDANTGILVGAIIKLFGAGTGLSDADREFAAGISGALRNKEFGSLQRMLNNLIEDKGRTVKAFEAYRDALKIDGLSDSFPTSSKAKTVDDYLEAARNGG